MYYKLAKRFLITHLIFTDIDKALQLNPYPNNLTGKIICSMNKFYSIWLIFMNMHHYLILNVTI